MKSFDEIRAERAALADDDPRQKGLALEDRRSYAKDYTERTGGWGALSLLVAVPLEAAYKAVRGHGRSGALPMGSAIGAGYTGIWQGLKATLKLDGEE